MDGSHGCRDHVFHHALSHATVEERQARSSLGSEGGETARSIRRAHEVPAADLRQRGNDGSVQERAPHRINKPLKGRSGTSTATGSKRRAGIWPAKRCSRLPRRHRSGRPMAKPIVTDGPFAETKEQLGGYYVLDVANADDAIEAGSRCPGAMFGTIELRPIQDFPDQPQG